MPRGDGTGPSGTGSGSGLGQGQGRKGGRGRMGGPASAGLSGNCVCPNCGHNESHLRGQPCNQRQCPKCGTMMTRN